MADNGPSPEQQADYLVRKLEQTIRDNRTVRGMSFRTWQAIAREEIVGVLKAAEKRRVIHERSLNRVVLIVSSTLVTIGFWGAVLAVDQRFGAAAAAIMGTAGLIGAAFAGDWAVRRAASGWVRQARVERFQRIEDLDRRIKRMETEMRKKADRLKEQMEDMGPL